ncbi:uncharacterized protein DS421_20g682240 [Arachis hypogaea]|nr:uncharacterized protein DS421_20g682240 [Arachis hypogaea]
MWMTYCVKLMLIYIKVAVVVAVFMLYLLILLLNIVGMKVKIIPPKQICNKFLQILMIDKP